MAMVPRSKPITPRMIDLATMLVKEARDDASLHRAVDKAANRMIGMPWRVTDEGTLEIASYSHPSEVHHCDDTYCSCPTQKGVCWHQGAWHILSAIAATGAVVEARLPLPDMAALDDLMGVVVFVHRSRTMPESALSARINAELFG